MRRHTRIDGGLEWNLFVNFYSKAEGEEGEGEIAMLLWKNSDGVYNFVTIGSIASTCISSIAFVSFAERRFYIGNLYTA